MTGSELLNRSIYFEGETLPFKVIAYNENFIICTRKLSRRADADILHYKVEMNAYCSFTQAYNDLKDEVVYTIIDSRNKIRGPHNMVISGYDFKEPDSMLELLADLESGETEVSRRNSCELKVAKVI